MTTKITEKNISSIANFAVQWQSVHVSDGSTALTTSAGKGYFIDTTSGAQTVNLPSVDDSTLGDTIILKDFARQWGTNNVTIAANTFEGINDSSPTFSTDGQTVTFVFTTTSSGWQLINDDTVTSLGQQYVAATGGTTTTVGDFKIHTFTGDGCFVVSCAGNTGGNNQLEYLVVAGGGGGGHDVGGGGGGGGSRFASPSIAPLTYPAKPLAGCTLTAVAQTYPVTVGSGGATSPNGQGNKGSNSVFSTITSTGGGGGGGTGGPSPERSGEPGGSGGGSGYCSSGNGTGGSGNTPPVSPSQGNNGGVEEGYVSGAGGGGMIGTGQNAQGPNDAGGPGGDGGGFPTAFGCNGAPCGSYRYYAGGGGGGGRSPSYSPAGSGGKGGAGDGNRTGAGTAGSANTGGGGGGSSGTGSPLAGAAGGKGIVVLRYKFQN